MHSYQREKGFWGFGVPACREPVEPVIVAGATEAEDIRMPEPATVRMFAPRA